MGEFNSEKARGSGGGSGSGQHLQHHVLTALDRFYPYRYRDGLSSDDLKALQERLAEKWAALRGRSLLDCVRIYLTCARKWAFFGAGLFQARLKAAPDALAQLVDGTGAGCQVWLAVAEDAVTLLDLAAMQPLARYPYGAVVTFGGCQEDFMLVVGAGGGGGAECSTASSSLPAPGQAPHKLLFALKPQDPRADAAHRRLHERHGHALPAPRRWLLTARLAPLAAPARGAARRRPGTAAATPPPPRSPRPLATLPYHHHHHPQHHHASTHGHHADAAPAAAAAARPAQVARADNHVMHAGGAGRSAAAAAATALHRATKKRRTSTARVA
ncbi:Uncharacterized protein GBIM_15497 [Gryllus bimaculatus]|nr:Uncharacterized protein GBIM_15497 [Gryllus bimaculatus]